jgi:ATP-binding cassette subfamily B protein
MMAKITHGTGIPSIMNFSIWDLYKWVAKYLRPYRFLGILLFGGLVLNQAFERFLPYTFKFILDDAIVPKDNLLLLRLLIGIGAAAVVFSVISFLLDILYAHVGNSILMDLRANLFRRIQTLDMNYHTGISRGELLSRFSSDVEVIENVVITMLPGGIISVFGVIFSAIMLFSLEWRMATTALIGITLSIIGVKLLEKRSFRSNLVKKEKLAELTTILEESLRARAVVYGFNLRDFIIDRYAKHLKNLYKISMYADISAYLMERIPNVGMMLVTVSTIAVGAIMTFNGVISIGTLVAFQTLLAGAIASLCGITSVLPFLIDSTTSAQRIEEVLRAKPSVAESAEAKGLPKISTGITFRNVDFGYTRGQKVLEGINLDVKHGWSVAFVGPSGCGKSTILNLVQRFYDPDSGEVLFDGQNIKNVKQDDLHKQISTVFQENFLFNMPIRENIRMGKLDATDDEIICAARMADAHEFILGLKDGYDTNAGDQGSSLSGGQRQRIAIARAIVRNPAILILDEATSALDPATEESISKTIEKLRNDHMILSVTHRLAPITKYDCIYVLDKGKLVESGRHEDLLKAQNLYARLWEKQSGFQINEEGVATVTLERLRKIPILDMLNDRQLATVSRFLVSEKFSEGREIVSQNVAGDKFYIIVRGKVTVKRFDNFGNETIVATLVDGDHFGEISLIKNVPRTASVISETPCILLTLTRDHFHALLNNSPKLKEKINNDLIERLLRIDRFHISQQVAVPG